VGPLEVVEPLLVHVTAGVLSEPRQILMCGIALCWEINALPSTMAASSRSLLDIVPVGLCVETRACWISLGNCTRHSMFCGDVAVGWMCTQQPPMPSLEASVVPITWGVVGLRCGLGPRGVQQCQLG